MNKILVILVLCCLVVACSGVKKPPLSETQIVNGKSIIIPPEFDVVPDKPQKAEAKSEKPNKNGSQNKKAKKSNKKDKK